MTKFSSEYRPPWAVVAWADEANVFIELPVKDGPPYIQRFPITEGGLGKALKVMIDAHFRFKKAGAPTRSFTMDDHPKIRRTRAKPTYTEEQRERALQLLRRSRTGSK